MATFTPKTKSATPTYTNKERQAVAGTGWEYNAAGITYNQALYTYNSDGQVETVWTNDTKN